MPWACGRGNLIVMLDLVIVTGAGRGIGRAIAEELATSAKMVLCTSASARCLDTAAGIRAAGGNAEGLQADLGKPAEVAAAISGWLKGKEVARIGLVAAAGTVGPSGPLWETPLDAWRVNVLGNLAVAQAALAMMRAQKFGRLLFFAGGGSAYAYPLFPAYAASKTALVRAVENLHEDLKEQGDFATAILAPGAVDTNILAEVRSKGGYVKTVVGIEEPVGFARAFINAAQCAFSGRFVHVRDSWPSLLEQDAKIENENLWKLRRVES